MSSDFRAQIRIRFSLKETEELLEIWQTNDRFEWSDDAFEIIKQILEERDVKIPEQNEPIYEHIEKKKEKEDHLSDEELKIIDDENPPAFYEPFDVLVATKRIDWVAKWMVVFTILYNIINFQRMMGIVQPYFIRDPDSLLIYVFTIVLLTLNTAIGIALVYFPLKALTHILRILMEMEFRSRKAN